MSAASVNIRKEISNTTTHTPAPISAAGTFSDEEWKASCIRFDQAVSEHERAANEWVHQMDHSKGHYYFVLAASEPAASYHEAAGDPESLAAARNYEFALPPHPTTFVAARSAYRNAQVEYRKARDEAQAQVDANKADIKRLKNKRKRI